MILLQHKKEDIEQKEQTTSLREIDSLKTNISELREGLERTSNEKADEIQKAVAKTNSENDNLRKLFTVSGKG